MDKVNVWFYILGSVLLAVLANYLSTVWAAKDNKFSFWLLAVVAVSPLVFITFGLVTTKFGLAITSCTIDSLLTIITVLVGLFIFQEWGQVSLYQYFGMSFAILGIILMQFHK